MKRIVSGAIAVVIWTVLVFLVGRATIPDRSQEVLDGRERAAEAVSAGAEEADRIRDSTTAAVEAEARRAATAESRAALAMAAADRQGARVRELAARLEAAATTRDSLDQALGLVEAVVEEVADLRSAFAAQVEAGAALRVALDSTQAQGLRDQAEIARLREVVRQGVEVTRPSRGSGLARTARTLVLGITIGVVGWEAVR